MIVNENEFFRESTFRICSHLDFEKALQESLLYLRTFMPADMFHLTIYDKGLGAFKIIALATPTEARKVKIIIPLDDDVQKIVKDHELHPAVIIDTLAPNPLNKAFAKVKGVWKEHSVMVMHLKVKGARPGNLVLWAKGAARYSKEHLKLFSILNEPFTIALSNALRYNELNRLKDIMADDIQYLQQKLHSSADDVIVGEDFGLKKVMDMVREVAPLDSPVLLMGETGVGKEIVANAIHNRSRRNNGPFVTVNCGAIPETLIDSELFGHEKGAFTGAINQKRGCFERAGKGTIFLDEIAELPPQAQVRMLRVLQEKKIVRVGGNKQIDVDIRIIAATHQNLREMVKNQKFRADLQFRLNVFPITIPPLRDRKEDIPALVNHLIEKKTQEMQITDTPKLAPGAINRLISYSWPGNVRELENIIERALILNKGAPLTFNDIDWADDREEMSISPSMDGKILPLDMMNATYIRKVLKMTNGKVHGPSGAATLLGINPGTLRYRMKKYGIAHGRKK